MSDEVQRAEVFGNASVFLHLVQCIDADPIAPKEAMLYGTPVVAAKRGGIASTVEPGFNGFFASNVKEAVESICAKEWRRAKNGNAIVGTRGSARS